MSNFRKLVQLLIDLVEVDLVEVIPFVMFFSCTCIKKCICTKYLYSLFILSQCNRGPALNSFFHDFNNDSQPTYISLLCCGCSVATIPVAEISDNWNIPHVSVCVSVCLCACACAKSLLMCFSFEYSKLNIFLVSMDSVCSGQE